MDAPMESVGLNSAAQGLAKRLKAKVTFEKSLILIACLLAIVAIVLSAIAIGRPSVPGPAGPPGPVGAMGPAGLGGTIVLPNPPPAAEGFSGTVALPYQPNQNQSQPPAPGVRL